MSTESQTFGFDSHDEFLITEDMTFSPLAQEGNIDWFLGRQASSGATFVLATAGNEESIFQVTQLLKNEFALRAMLSDNWSLKPQKQTYYQGRYALIYRAFNYRTLADVLCMPPGSMSF